MIVLVGVIAFFSGVAAGAILACWWISACREAFNASDREL